MAGPAVTVAVAQAPRLVKPMVGAVLGLIILAGVAASAVGVAMGQVGQVGLQAPPLVLQAAQSAASVVGTPSAEVLLAIAYDASHFGQEQEGIPDDRAAVAEPAGLDLGRVRAELAAGGQMAVALGLAAGRIPGDWMDPTTLGGDPRIGLMHVRRSDWTGLRAEGLAVSDPYQPSDSMLAVATYLRQASEAAGGSADAKLLTALQAIGGSEEYAKRIMGLVAAGASGVLPGRPVSCPHLVYVQGYGPSSAAVEPPSHGFAHFHTGLDLSCPEGSQVVSVSAGRAQSIFNPGGYGLYVLVQSGDLYFVYAHLDASVITGGGEDVVAGQPIGLEGGNPCPGGYNPDGTCPAPNPNAGLSTGAHLHFEVDRDCPAPRCSIDPFPYVDPAILAGGPLVPAA